MPELPEVETVRRGLNKLVKGSKIRKIDILYPKIIEGDVNQFSDNLKGEKIEKVDRRGKYLLFRLSNDMTMISHLRMEGKYYVKKDDEKLEKHTHIVFNLEDNRQLRYNDVRKFGRMSLVKTGHENEIKAIKKLGPEPTEKEFGLKKFIKDLEKKRKNIKSALLDQTLVAGLGNIYVDEVLWLSKIHPKTSCSKLTQKEVKILRENIIEELKKAVLAGGTTIRSYTNAFEHNGKFQFSLNVYGKKGKPCKRCQSIIEKTVVGQRGTYFCPNCQVLK